MSEAARPDCAQVSRFEAGDFLPPTAESDDFERPTVLLPLRAQLPLVFGQSVLPLGEGAYKGSSRLLLPRRAALVVDAPAGSYLAMAVPRVQEPCTLLTLRRVGERQHASILQLREAAAMDAAAAGAAAGRARLAATGALPVGQPPVPPGRWNAQSGGGAQQPQAFW